MSDIHFSKNYQLESIRSDLAKVIGAVNSLLPPKPLAPVPSTAGHYFKGVPYPVYPVLAGDPVPVETYDDGKRGINRKPRSETYVSGPLGAAMQPAPVEPEPCEVPFSSLENSRIAKYQTEILELTRQHQEELAESKRCYIDVEASRLRVVEDARVLRVENLKLISELHDLSRKHDIALLKLKDIHALSGITGDPHLTSKLNTVEFP